MTGEPILYDAFYPAGGNQVRVATLVTAVLGRDGSLAFRATSGGVVVMRQTPEEGAIEAAWKHVQTLSPRTRFDEMAFGTPLSVWATADLVATIAIRTGSTYEAAEAAAFANLTAEAEANRGE
ncbi:MAG: hypothetical protein JNK72_24940 [Myxococcales bacterium]|nr:hypothetical protein [Myxococcales bacterium]